ncbi:MAG: DNA polymerase I [Ruminococcus sp.]|nr:DNA polymerase I [Ruminococcus sp.]
MKLLAIDGNSILNRAYYGIKLLSNKKGVFTNALTGFMNIYLKEIEIVKPDCVMVAFDLKAPTFRHKAVSSYKANRKGMPDELAMQLPLIKDILGGLGIKISECEGFEADDILGTVSSFFAESGNECVILTGDRDSLQLINEKVHVRLVTNKETIEYDERLFFESYGFEPLNLIDLKALMGDSSDNISGVPGIGEKTASTLIKKYRTIEALYASLDPAAFTKSVYNKLCTGKEAAFQSKWLATIVKNAPIENDTKSYKPGKADEDRLSRVLTELEMFKLIERLKLKPFSAPAEERELTLFDDFSEEQSYQEAVLDNEALIKITDSGKADFVFYADEKRISILSSEQIYTSDNAELIRAFFESETEKRTFGAKPAYRYAFENGYSLRNIVFDAEIAAYLLDPIASGYEPDKLCASYGVRLSSDSKNAAVINVASLSDKLAVIIENQNMTELLYNIEQPLTEVLASMETVGVKVDTDGVKKFGEMLLTEISGCQKMIYELAGREFNISSPKQLGEILFGELGLPAKKKTKSGYSTNAEVLEELRPKHPIIDHILKYRQLTKLNSTYVDGLLKTVSSDGRIHSVFRQTETRTGRISSTEPNMQNIPVRTELGSKMRSFFVADTGKILLDADYSQIELRIMAHICGDENMRQAFIDGTDIHTMTASQVFDMPPIMVTSSMRSAAKAVNFGIIYGIGAFSLSKDIGVSVAEADKYIRSYLDNYPDVERFMNETVENAEKDGYVSTMFGRRRAIPELIASNKMLKAAGKRIAMNTPIQGSAADIIKIAMIRVYKRLSEENLKARLILQVHDELIVESDTEDSQRAAQILAEEMTNAAELSIPLIAEVNSGETWYDAKS